MPATEIDFSDAKKAQRLLAKFPKEYSGAKFRPLPIHEQTVVEYMKAHLPYYVLTYCGDLASYVPYVGKYLSTAIDAVARYYRVEPKTIL